MLVSFDGCGFYLEMASLSNSIPPSALDLIRCIDELQYTVIAILTSSVFVVVCYSRIQRISSNPDLDEDIKHQMLARLLSTNAGVSAPSLVTERPRANTASALGTHDQHSQSPRIF